MSTPEDVAARALDNAVEVQLKLADRVEKAEAEVKRLHAALAGLLGRVRVPSAETQVGLRHGQRTEGRTDDQRALYMAMIAAAPKAGE